VSATLITWLKQIKSTYGKYQSFEKHSAAAKRAANGQKPYEQTKEVQTELSHLEDLSKQLREIASKGIGEPEKSLEWKDLLPLIQQLEGSDKERDEAVKRFRLMQLSRAEHTDKGAELTSAIKEVAQSAATRRDAATQVRDQFGKLLENFPDPTGGTIKVQLFECYQAFDAAGGALAGVASAGDDAVKKIDKEVEDARKKTKDMVKAFEEAYKTSEKVRKAKKKNK
jgi:hypothetical protein